jgi:hypothetical protein
VLLVAGRWRAAAAAGVTAAALGAATLLALGVDGVRAYQRSVAFELQHMVAGHFTTTAMLGGALPAAVIAVVPAALALLVAAGRRDGEIERPIVAGVLASHLASPYLNGADLALLVPCAWLTLRSGAPRWIGWGAVAVTLLPALVRGDAERTVAVVGQLVWLVALAAPVVGAAAGRARAAVWSRPLEE